MDWLGSVGAMHFVSKYQDCKVVHYLGNLFCLEYLTKLGLFKRTLELLCSYKRHNQNLALMIALAQKQRELAKKNEQLHLQSMNKKPNEFTTFFTPTKRQKRNTSS
ncbi:hypothetical protein PS15m_007694 [Mucor circinelloides]